MLAKQQFISENPSTIKAPEIYETLPYKVIIALIFFESISEGHKATE